MGFPPPLSHEYVSNKLLFVSPVQGWALCVGHVVVFRVGDPSLTKSVNRGGAEQLIMGMGFLWGRGKTILK